MIEAEPVAPEPESVAPEAETVAPIEAAPDTATTVADTEPSAAVAEASVEEAGAEEADTEDSAEVEPIIFSDEEWQIFRTLMSGFTKPASFAQIFDSLRDLRKQQNISRTNEQLRTMVKQAINGGILERSGRGKRIYYKLKSEE